MAIDSNPKLCAQSRILPPSYQTLYDLSRLPDAEFDAALEAGASVRVAPRILAENTAPVERPV